MRNPPEISIWLELPEGCYIQGQFTEDRDIHITFGELDGLGSQQYLLFVREALERFVKLDSELVAMPLPEDRKAELPVLVA